ncbi:MAG: hypothetical protein IJR70_09145 [Eubacterium sp.]|nr:hypothetical protein [Eubacterium sp.]
MKKSISLVLSIIMLLSTLAGFNLTAYANWVSDCKNVDLNTWYGAVVTNYDYDSNENSYLKGCYFTLPAAGKITFKARANSEYDLPTDFMIFKSNNLENPLRSTYNGDFFDELDYYSGLGCYQDSFAVTLSKGSYYLMMDLHGYVESGYFDYSLSFYPQFSNVSLTKVVALKKGFKATWKKASSATGYQIQYSRNSNMSSAKTITCLKNTKVSYATQKLSAKKKYYVRIRTYKKIKGSGINKTYYGKWSSKKTVVTKK